MGVQGGERKGQRADACAPALVQAQARKHVSSRRGAMCLLQLTDSLPRPRKPYFHVTQNILNITYSWYNINIRNHEILSRILSLRLYKRNTQLIHTRGSWYRSILNVVWRKFCWIMISVMQLPVMQLRWVWCSGKFISRGELWGTSPPTS